MRRSFESSYGRIAHAHDVGSGDSAVRATFRGIFGRGSHRGPSVSRHAGAWKMPAEKARIRPSQEDYVRDAGWQGMSASTMD